MTGDLNATFGHRPFIKNRREASLRLSLPHRGRGTAPAVDRVLPYIACLRRSYPLLFIRSCPIRPFGAPSPRGEGYVSGIPLSPSNLRPFGAPPSIGRRECTREPLPLEGARGAARRGWLSLLAAKPPPLCLPHYYESRLSGWAGSEGRAGGGRDAQFI